MTRRVELGTQFLLAVTQPRRRLIVLTADRCILLLYNLGNFCTQTRDLVGVADILHAHTRCCLIHQVDCLVRQTAIRDVALREAHRRANGGILNARTVELLVFTAQPAKNLLCILLARLFHHDGLEAARESGILCKMLLVLAERRGADDLHLAARKRRLQNVCRVKRALRATGADERMDLVDEEDDALRLDDIIHHILEAFLELAAVLCPRHERRHR